MSSPRVSARNLVAVVATSLLAGGAAGCATAARPAEPRPAPLAPAEPTIVASPVVITPRDDDPHKRFDDAWKLLHAGRFREAAEAFDALAKADAPLDLVAASVFDGGIAWESAGERERALDHFRDAMRRFPDGEAGHGATVRAVRALAYLERWSELSTAADALLARSDLSDLDRIEGLGAKALAIVEAGDADGAERNVSKARDIVEARRLGEGGKLPVELAPVWFALGEIRRVRSEKIVFVPAPASFGEALERRCQGLLDAQSAFTDAMRSYDPHWAAMSGYRVGQLYQQLHRDVIDVPPPKTATTTAKKQLFEGAMRLRYRVLLEKGLKMMEHTVSLGDQTGENSAWIARAREARADLERALASEKDALARLPYTEADLRRALDALAAQKP